MPSSIRHSCLAALSLAVLVPLATACATDDAVDNGTLELPLQQAGPDGAIYQLVGTVELDGPAETTRLDVTGTAPTVTISVPPGLFDVKLLDGWTLQRSLDGGGSYQPAPAILGTPNPTTVRILGNQPTKVSFQFLIRDPNGNLTVNFGVTTEPRELAGGMIIDAATGDYAAYANQRLDYAIYYDLAQTFRSTAADGSRDLGYIAGFVGVEFFNDSIGLLSGQVGPAMDGGALALHIGVTPTGDQVLSGALDSANAPFTTLLFGPHSLPDRLPLDADGFPIDGFIFDSFVPFTLNAPFDPDHPDAFLLSGQLRFRALPSVGSGS